MPADLAPWESVPADAAALLRPVIPTLSDEIIAAIRREVDDYARPLEGPFGRAVRLGTERALSRFLDLIADPAHEDPRGRQIYVELGRGEFRQGRSLDALLSAYRVGARLAWRRFVETGKSGGLEPDVLYQLGEAIFAYIDAISAESIEGYAEAQSAAAGERQRQRRRLVTLLRQEPAPEERVVAAAASEANWDLPAALAALVVAGEEPEALAGRLGGGAIAVSLDDEAVLVLVPDPDAPGRLSQLRSALRDAPAALGPAVPWPETARSVDRARLAHRLLRDGLLPGPLAVADEHLAALLLHAEPQLGEELAAAALRPLHDLPPGPRRKLEETLRAWLDEQGRVEAAARVLGVHAQTVRYRLNQLREVFGARLDDAEERFALSAALRATRTGAPPAR